MAIEKVIKINVDQVQAAGGLEKFTESLNKTEKSSQSLKAELRQLKQQLSELPEGTAQYNEIAKRAGEVSDKIGDISTRVKNLGSDTKNIDAVVQGAQTLSGAFTVATSATQLFGVENADLQKQMAKVEAAIGLTVGIQSIANALQKESALYIGLSNLATKIQIGLQVAYAAVVGTTTGALKALRVALVSTGVGALVVALGFLVSKMTESKDATEDQDEALKSLDETTKRYAETLKNDIKQIENSTRIRLLRAKIIGKSEQDLRDIEKEGEVERAKAIKAEEDRIDKQLQNRKLTEKQYDLLIKRREELQDEALNYAQERDVKSLEFDLDIANKKRDAQKKSNEDAKAAAKKREEERKAELERLYTLEQQWLKKQNDLELSSLDAIDEAKKSNADFNKSAQQVEVDDTTKKYETLIANAQKFGQDTSDLETAKWNAVNDINLKYQQIKYDADKAQADKDKLLVEEVAKHKEEQLRANVENVNTILNIGGQRFAKIQKALAIAEVVRDTIRAVNAATGNEIKVPAFIGTIPNPVKPASLLSTALSIGGAVAKGVASIAAINNDSKSVAGGGGVGGASGGGGGATAPSFNIVGQNPNNQLAQSIAQQQKQPIQAFVVSGNVTNAQSLDRNRIDTATFN